MLRFAVLVSEGGECDLYRNKMSKLPVEFSSKHSAEEKMKEENIEKFKVVCLEI